MGARNGGTDYIQSQTTMEASLMRLSKCALDSICVMVLDMMLVCNERVGLVR